MRRGHVRAHAVIGPVDPLTHGALVLRGDDVRVSHVAAEVPSGLANDLAAQLAEEAAALGPGHCVEANDLLDLATLVCKAKQEKKRKSRGEKKAFKATIKKKIAKLILIRPIYYILTSKLHSLCKFSQV